jgi:DNA-binding MarR family transcriptional regulator
MQAHLLNGLEPDEPLRMNVIADELDCDASHVTGIVDRLERGGLVERQAMDGDRRVKLVVLTPHGAVVRRALLEELLDPPEMLRELGARDQRTLRDLLRRLLVSEIRPV